MKFIYYVLIILLFACETTNEEEKNNPPSINSTLKKTAAEGIEFRYQLTATDPDVDDVLSYTFENVPTWLSVSGNMLIGTPEKEHVGNSPYRILLIVSDDKGLKDTDTLKVYINGSPFITSNLDVTTNEDEHFSYTITASDDSTSLTYTVQNLPSWLSFDGQNTLSGTPKNEDVSVDPYSVELTVTDGVSSSNSETLLIRVVNVNDAPELTSELNDSAMEGVYYTYKLSALDIDINDVFTFSVDGLPAWLEFDGVDMLRGTPTGTDIVNSVEITLKVRDLAGEMDEKKMILAVEPFTAHVATLSDGKAGGSLTIDTDGNVYISDIIGSSDWNSPNGTKIYKLDAQNNLSDFITGILQPVGKVFDSEGNMFVNSYSGRKITKHTPSGVSSDFATGFGDLTGMAMGKNDTLIVSEIGNGILKKVAPDGQSIEFARNSLLVGVNGIIFDDHDELYGANWYTGKIVKIDASGNVSEFAQLPLDGPQWFQGTGFVAFGNNRFYATSLGTNKIYEISRSGSIKVLAGSGNVGYKDSKNLLEAEFEQPNGIIVSNDGKKLYVSETLRKRIRVIYLSK